MKFTIAQLEVTSAHGSASIDLVPETEEDDAVLKRLSEAKLLCMAAIKPNKDVELATINLHRGYGDNSKRTCTCK